MGGVVLPLTARAHSAIDCGDLNDELVKVEVERRT
jgi:hypothetical protein